MGCASTRQAAFAAATLANTPAFSPSVTHGKVIKVYDGDTITIAAPVVGVDGLFRFRVRLAGIDTPELRGASAAEKAMAVRARDALASQLPDDMMVTLTEVDASDKYGRLLARVWVGRLCLNAWMLEQRHAKAYDGKAKSVWVCDAC